MESRLNIILTLSFDNTFTKETYVQPSPPVDVQRRNFCLDCMGFESVSNEVKFVT